MTDQGPRKAPRAPGAATCHDTRSPAQHTPGGAEVAVRDRTLPWPILALLLTLPVAWSVLYWFVCDDAFISFRFVRNLLLGHGLVWNPGEYVEGYTNFLWVLELAALWGLLGLRPEIAAPVLSEILTVATGALVITLAARTPQREHRTAVVLIALTLWATNRSVAVWATSGLETRQFTFLITLGFYLLTRWREGWRWIAAGSAAYGLAALTRPEALLIGPLTLAWCGADHLRARRFTARNALAAAAPFLALVGTHLLWRRAYYGEWLPNTYYAKNVRDWWEGGTAFLSVVAIEHALWAVIPLAIVGTWARWQRDDTSHAALWVWWIPSTIHLAKIGGDHFEFRMFDELWPVLYVAAADGLVRILAGLRPRALLPAATAVVVAWGLAIPVAHDIQAFQRQGRRQTAFMTVTVDATTTPWIRAIPPLPWLLPAYNRLSAWTIEHSIGIRQREHKAFIDLMRAWYEPFQAWEGGEGLFRDDALAAESSIGAYGYYLWDLRIIDKKGLCDHTIARAPVHVSDDDRRLAHDRNPPPGYLEARGVNLEVERYERSLAAALRGGDFAVPLEDGNWLSFESPMLSYVPSAFPGRTLHTKTELADPFRGGTPAESRATTVATDSGPHTVARRLFDLDGDRLGDGWVVSGAAFERQPARGGWLNQKPEPAAYEGRGLLNSFHPSWRNTATGEARSPAFTLQPGERLGFLLGGTRQRAEVRLEGAEGAAGPWIPQTPRLRWVVVDAPAGVPLQLVAKDTGGVLLLDSVVTLLPAAPPPR